MKFAIISDIHEDIVCLEKAFRLIDRTSCDKIVCLGDIVGFAEDFYPYSDTKNANKCVNLVKANCDIVVPGNHDLHVVKKIPKYFKDQNFPDNWYELPPKQRAEISNYRSWFYETETECILSDTNFDFLHSLKEYHIEKSPIANIIFSHFVFPDLTGSTNRFPTKRKDFNQHFEFMKSQNTSLSIVGHSHVQGYARVKEKRRAFFNGFSSGKLKSANQILYTSSIASSKRKNGFLIIDTSEMTIEAVKLN